jgi:hypothetical protein
VKIIFYLAIVFLAVAAECRGATHYVVPTNPALADPYTNWATAGTNIIDVVNAAMTNNTTLRVVWVTNGTYYPTNVINITNSLTLQSVNGRDLTILAGQGSLTTNRCAYFSVADSVLDGFTVTNYYVVGQAGAVSAVGSISILNCLFVGNSNIYTELPSGFGGGVCIDGNLSVLTNCIFSNNYAFVAGGGLGIRYTTLNRIENCVFNGNYTIP